MNGKLWSNQIELISFSNSQVLSTKLLNKKTNKKLKSVTIIHSATTETVRLPEDNNGVIVHTAVRTKVPLKQKVRGERGKKKKKSSDHKKTTSDKLGEASHATAAGGGGAVVRPKRKKTTGRSQEQRPQQQQHQQKKLLSLYKSKSSSNKKEIIDYSKKRMGGGASDKPAGTDLSAIGKVQKWLLDSPANAGNDGENSSIISGDVLQSNSTAAAMESIALKKSASTPERLLSGGGGLGGSAAMKKQMTMLNGNGGAQQEKVKLQVVYKPPFKFSLKLKKRNPVSTTVVSPYRVKKNVVAGTTQAGAAAGGKKNGMRSGGQHDKNRIGIMSSSSQDKSTILRKNRLALLIRSEKDAGDASTSRGDELLLPSGSGKDTSRYYENVDHKPVNSATFRIKKSSSSGNASQLERNGMRMEVTGSSSGERKRTGSSTMKSNNSKDSLGATDTNTTMASDRSRDISIKSGGGGGGGFKSSYASNSTERGNLKDQLGGSGNLVMRSSTTNLAKMNGGNFQKNEKTRNSLNMQRQMSSPAGDSTFKRTSDSNSNVLLGRNATATSIHNNLQNGNMIMFKKLSTSNTNLAKFSDEFLARRASNSSLNNAGMLPRRPSINSSATPKRRASINSHRQQGSAAAGTSGTTASGGGGTNGSFDRRASMGSHNAKKSKGSSRSGGGGSGLAAASSRPHTATCDTDRSVPFEWPPPPMDVAKRLDDPLPSDMEVLCSDVEHSAFQDR